MQKWEIKGAKKREDKKARAQLWLQKYTFYEETPEDKKKLPRC